MIANVAVERAYALAADPEAATALWQTLRRARLFGSPTAGRGALTGPAGLLTVLPPLGEIAGAAVGLGAGKNHARLSGHVRRNFLTSETFLKKVCKKNRRSRRARSHGCAAIIPYVPVPWEDLS